MLTKRSFPPRFFLSRCIAAIRSEIGSGDLSAVGRPQRSISVLARVMSLASIWPSSARKLGGEVEADADRFTV